MGKFEHVILVCTLLAASFLVLLGGAAEIVEGGEPTRGGIDDPFEGTVYFQDIGGPFYPGQHERLYVALYSDYDGSGFEGSSSPGNVTSLKEVKVSYMGLYYEEDGTPAPSQTNLGTASFYNNDGDGYDIARWNNQNYYADSSNNFLEFDVITTDLQPGDYLTVWITLIEHRHHHLVGRGRIEPSLDTMRVAIAGPLREKLPGWLANTACLDLLCRGFGTGVIL